MITQLEPTIGIWKRSYAWFPVYVTMREHKDYYGKSYDDGDAYPKLRIWLESYEWRRTGSRGNNSKETEYRIHDKVYVQWESFGCVC